MALDLNKYQTPLDDKMLVALPDEVRDQLFDIVNNVPFVKSLISKDREYAKDRPRDEQGRIIVDLTKPHILENVDYFRPTALFYEKTGRMTDLRPNANPNSAFGKWIREEQRRCWDGYVRESDGEWVTGYMYWYLNYCPIMLSKIRRIKNKQGKWVNSKRADRIEAMPEFWEGIYWRFHYIDQAARLGKHCMELAARGVGKSYTLASILAHIFVLGENEEAHNKVTGIVTAYQKEYLVKDGTLNKFVDMINFCATHTQFPRRRLKSSLQEMSWIMGYKDAETDIEKGTQNAVLGVTSKDNESKMRGKRAAKILIDEVGTFPRLLEMYNVILPSVQEGDIVFGQIIGTGTAGDKDSDFSSVQEIMYNPDGYNMYALENVYDKFNQGRPKFTYFFPGYINRKGCYNKDGVSDVIKALCEILMNRYRVKYNSSDPNTIIKTIAEIPITPAEAIIKLGMNMFPVTDLTQRLAELDANPNEYDDVYVGELVFDKSNNVVFKPTYDIPIREFPHKDNKIEGAVEIFTMPEIEKKTGKPYGNRYIAGSDPYDDDQANTLSLGSTFVLDLWTDRIVAEYTGRPLFADDYYEITRKMCLFYNARLNYEAHPYDQEVNTPDGVRLWGDIEVGDVLFTPDGGTTKVVDIPMDGEDDIYKITLVDGRAVEASRKHIWLINRLNTKEYVEMTTEELFREGAVNKFEQHNFFLPQNEGVEYAHRDVPIDPYTLGLLIANGALTKFVKVKKHNKKRNIVQLSALPEDAAFYASVIPYPMHYVDTKGYSYHVVIDDVEGKLMEIGLLHKDSHTKFIPEIYMHNSREVRLELLKGLMDGDGCAPKKGGCIYTSVSQELLRDVRTLCRSLGFRASKQHGVKQIKIAAKETIFKLPRKVQRQYVYKEGQRGSKATAIFYKTAIADISYVGRKKCKCVTVDNPQGLYLIGDYVVTHNCNKKGLFSYFSSHNSVYLLTDTLEYLRDKQLIKGLGFGNTSKGTTATLPVNNYARERLRAWLLSPVTVIKKADGQDVEQTVSRLYTVRNRALIKELINYNSEGNFDRVSAMGMLMLLREDRMILYQGNVSRDKYEHTSADYLGNDPFFTKNYKPQDEEDYKINY